LSVLYYSNSLLYPRKFATYINREYFQSILSGIGYICA
jgi:hypothetical protein